MRFKKIKEIVNLLFLFLERNVLNIGLLKNKVFRIIMFTIMFVIIAFLSFELYYFFESTNSSYEQTSVVIDSYSCSVFMWTFLIFLFIKILFMRKGNLTVLTFQMPVTNREKNISVLIFEIIIALGVVFGLSSSMIIALLLKYGFVFLERIICNVVFNCITAYFVFELSYGVMNYLCNIFALGRVKNVLIICLLSLVLIIFYIVVIPDIFLSILYTFKEKTGTSNILFYMVVSEKYNFLVAVLLFLIITFFLVGCIVLIPDNNIEKGGNYVKLGRNSLKKNGLFTSYILAYLRKADTFNYYFIILFIFVIMQIMNIRYSYYLILILSINSLYAYIQTEGIRNVMMQKNYNSVMDFCFMLGAQYVYIIILSIPLDFAYSIMSHDVHFLVLQISAVFFSVIFFTMGGILFPAKNENPFSAIVGISFIVIIGIIMISVCFLLKLDIIKIIISMIVLSVFACIVSIVGLKRLFYKSYLSKQL